MNIPDVIIGEGEENEKEVVIEWMITVEIVKEVPTMIVIMKEIIKETVIAIVFAIVKELEDLTMQLVKFLRLLRLFLLLVHNTSFVYI